MFLRTIRTKPSWSHRKSRPFPIDLSGDLQSKPFRNGFAQKVHPTRAQKWSLRGRNCCARTDVLTLLTVLCTFCFCLKFEVQTHSNSVQPRSNDIELLLSVVVWTSAFFRTFLLRRTKNKPLWRAGRLGWFNKSLPKSMFSFCLIEQLALRRWQKQVSRLSSAPFLDCGRGRRSIGPCKDTHVIYRFRNRNRQKWVGSLLLLAETSQLLRTVCKKKWRMKSARPRITQSWTLMLCVLCASTKWWVGGCRQDWELTWFFFFCWALWGWRAECCNGACRWLSRERGSNDIRRIRLEPGDKKVRGYGNVGRSLKCMKRRFFNVLFSSI